MSNVSGVADGFNHGHTFTKLSQSQVVRLFDNHREQAKSCTDPANRFIEQLCWIIDIAMHLVQVIPLISICVISCPLTSVLQGESIIVWDVTEMES